MVTVVTSRVWLGDERREREVMEKDVTSSLPVCINDCRVLPLISHCTRGWREMTSSLHHQNISMAQTETEAFQVGKSKLIDNLSICAMFTKLSP